MKKYEYDTFFDETLEEVFNEKRPERLPFLILKKEHLGIDVGIVSMLGSVRVNEYDYTRTDGKKSVFFELTNSCGDGFVSDVFTFVKDNEKEEITLTDFMEAYDKEEKEKL